MRIAYVCRGLAGDTLTGTAARVFATAQAMSRGGHEVYLLSQEIAAARARALLSPASATWLKVEQTRLDHLFHTQTHEYSYWVYDALSELHARHPLDLVEFTDAGAEGLATIRAKRLLGEFATATLAVSRNPWATVREGPAAYRPLTLEHQLTGFAEAYCLEHADIRLEVEPPEWTVTPAVTEAANERTVWRLGSLRPKAGLGTFLRAAGLVLEVDAGYRFVLRGDDTQTDPLGRSYWRHVRSRLPDAVREAVRFEGPLRAADGGGMPGSGTPCVLPQGDAECPSTASFAVAMGWSVIAPKGSTAAEVVEDGVSGIVVPASDPQALAAAMLKRDTVEYRRREPGWRQPGSPRCGMARPATVKPTSAETATVSVVVPLYNQGEYLEEALESVRGNGYPEMEIVVVDDGSTEPRTIEAFDALAGVVMVRQRNMGLPAARNAGINASRGSLIVPLDADDTLPPGFLSAAVAALRRNPEVSYVVGHVRNTGLLDHVQVPLGHAGDASLVVNTHGRATGLFRREALLAVGGYDEELPACEDWDLHIRLHKAGFTSDVLPVEGQRYRRHEGSMTFTHTNDRRLESLQLLLRKHFDATAPQRTLSMLLTMAQLWKSGYEPSASVRWQQQRADRNANRNADRNASRNG